MFGLPYAILYSKNCDKITYEHIDIKLEPTLYQFDFRTIKEVEDLVVVNDGLRSQELLFRDHCKQELVRLQNRIELVNTICF